MKYKKTPMNERGHYAYYIYTETKKGIWRKKMVTDLHPGDVFLNKDGVEEVITEEIIDILHKSDDHLVYNNNKNAKPPLTKWQYECLVKWKEAHPCEDVPKNYNASIDFILDTDESDFDTEQSHIAAACAVYPSVDFELMVEEGLNALSKEERDIFIAICIEHRKGCELAKKLGLSEATISRRLRSAKEIMKEYLPEPT